jgi:hypothetical protein
MFIAPVRFTFVAPEERYVIGHMALRTERAFQNHLTYKHAAPSEQTRKPLVAMPDFCAVMRRQLGTKK